MRLLLLSIFYIFSSAVMAEVIQCTDKSGEDIYTDNKWEYSDYKEKVRETKKSDLDLYTLRKYPINFSNKEKKSTVHIDFKGRYVISPYSIDFFFDEFNVKNSKYEKGEGALTEISHIEIAIAKKVRDDKYEFSLSEPFIIQKYFYHKETKKYKSVKLSVSTYNLKDKDLENYHISANIMSMGKNGISGFSIVYDGDIVPGSPPINDADEYAEKP